MSYNTCICEFLDREISELHKANAAAASQTATAKLSVEMQAKQELQMAMERQQLTYKQQMEALMAQVSSTQVWDMTLQLRKCQLKWLLATSVCLALIT